MRRAAVAMQIRPPRPRALAAMLQVEKAILAVDQETLGRELELTEPRDWTWRGRDGRTVLELAVLLGQPEMVKVLVRAGAATDHLSGSGYGALHVGCIWGQLGCVRELVRAGANHRVSTTLGETPLQLALRYGHTACANYLCCAEGRCVLAERVQTARETLANTELVAGRWNKEDKSKVTALCAEKSDWLASNEECSEEEVQQQTNDFNLRMQPYLDKLAE